MFEGDTEVINALKEKKQLLSSGQSHDHIRPLLVIGGGLMRGVYGAGAVTALYDKGFGEVFDNVIAVSTGAPTAAYFLGGNPRSGSSIYYEECCSRTFLRGLSLREWFTNFCATYRDPLNLVYLDSVFRGATLKPIDTERVFKSRTKFHIAVTDVETATARYINSCDTEQLHTAIIASCNVPGLNYSKHYINDKQVTDGVIGSPFPVDFIKTLNPRPTHILVIANRTKGTMPRSTRLQSFTVFNILFRNRSTKVVRERALKRFKKFEEQINEFLETPACRAVVWTDGKVKGTERNTVLLKNTTAASEAWWHGLLAK